MCCVQIPDTVPDEITSAALVDLAERVARQHGDLAVFPSRYVRTVQH